MGHADQSNSVYKNAWHGVDKITYLLSTYYVLGVLLSILYGFTHLIITKAITSEVSTFVILSILQVNQGR